MAIDSVTINVKLIFVMVGALGEDANLYSTGLAVSLKTVEDNPSLLSRVCEDLKTQISEITTDSSRWIWEARQSTIEFLPEYF